MILSWQFMFLLLQWVFSPLSKCLGLPVPDPIRHARSQEPSLIFVFFEFIKPCVETSCDCCVNESRNKVGHYLVILMHHLSLKMHLYCFILFYIILKCLYLLLVINLSLFKFLNVFFINLSSRSKDECFPGIKCFVTNKFINASNWPCKKSLSHLISSNIHFPSINAPIKRLSLSNLFKPSNLVFNVL